MRNLYAENNSLMDEQLHQMDMLSFSLIGSTQKARSQRGSWKKYLVLLLQNLKAKEAQKVAHSHQVYGLYSAKTILQFCGKVASSELRSS